MAVNALKSPPTRSTAREISCAERRSVPLNSRCSRKWLTPLTLLRLVARADADPDAGGHRQRPRDAFGGHRQAGVQLCDPQITHGLQSRLEPSGCAQRWRRRPPRSPPRPPRSLPFATCGGPASGLATRAEIAELAGELGVERVVERHGGHGAGAGALAARGLGPVAALRALTARCGAARRVGRTAAVAALRVPGGGRREADLALLVDLLDHDLDLLTEREHVLDRVDPLAAAQLGDVHQAVAAREDVDERTELGDVDDATRCRWRRRRPSADRRSPGCASGPLPSSPGRRHRW